jgi:CBS domain-containing protein
MNREDPHMPHQMLIEEVVRARGGDELHTVPASATVGDAVALMAECEIGAVLVMNDDGLVSGIFTERDLLLRVVHAGRDVRDTPISLVMTRNVRFVTPGTTVEAAMALMHLNRHRHLLVIDGPSVHGLVSMRDLVFQIVRRGPQGFAAALPAGDDAAAP